MYESGERSVYGLLASNSFLYGNGNQFQITCIRSIVVANKFSDLTT